MIYECMLYCKSKLHESLWASGVSDTTYRAHSKTFDIGLSGLNKVKNVEILEAVCYYSRERVRVCAHRYFTYILSKSWAKICFY